LIADHSPDQIRRVDGHQCCSRPPVQEVQILEHLFGIEHERVEKLRVRLYPVDKPFSEFAHDRKALG
jgi:hypothetical protein